MTGTKNLWVIGHKIEPMNTSGEYDAFIAETPAGVPGPPPHYHSRFAELFLVLKGKMEFTVNGEKRILNEGESIDIPPGTVHTFNNATSEPIKWINIHSPKGFYSFFERFGIPGDNEDAFQSSVSASLIGQVLREAATFDMNIVSRDD